MMHLVLTVLSDDILPIFLVAAVGFLLARRLHVDVRALSRVTFNALAPCLVFDLLVSNRVSAGDVGLIALFTVLLVLAIGALAALVAWPFRLDRPALAAFLIVAMFSNAGNYGMSVVLFAFGREVLARAVVYFVTSSILLFTLGIVVASSGRRGVSRALTGVFRVPAVYGVLAAGLVIGAGVTVPPPLMRPVELLGSAAIPTMLLVLGMQFERTARPERPGLVAAAAGLILVVSPAIGYLLAGLLGLPALARQAVIVDSAMPSAVITTVLALEMDVAPGFVTSVVVVTTLLSPVSVALVIALLKSGW